MPVNNSWKEEAWEVFLQKYWDSQPKNVQEVGIEYRKSDLDPILSKYTKSGQGEIRIFHSGSKKVEAVKKRGIIKVPLSRSSWKILKSPPNIAFKEPQIGGFFIPFNEPTEGMIQGIIETVATKSNPGETTLLAIANYTGVIADFYNLSTIGTLFTGGRQKAGIHLVMGTRDLDMTQAQIEIDGGFEWPNTVVIVEMKSSFKQNDFDINQALIPMRKWAELLKNKQVYSLVLLAETSPKGLEYWAYDLKEEANETSLGMKVVKNKKYIIPLKQ